MDIHRNLLFSGNLPTTQSIHDTLKAEYPPVSVQTPAIPGDCPGSLDEFLFNGKSQERDIGLEWLSIYVEDCFSVTGNYLSGENPATASQLQKTAPTKPAGKPAGNFQKPNLELVVPGKARTKRKRASNGWSHDQEPPLFQSGFDVDPPLLYQAHWLADSELLIQKPKENPTQAVVVGGEEMVGKGNSNSGSSEGSNGQPRRCSHCLTQKTPQWRAGPMGAKTLCNACGVRFKSGRLLPEYRPAKSPTFESFKHSNSHKKVMEMRSTIVSE